MIGSDLSSLQHPLESTLISAKTLERYLMLAKVNQIRDDVNVHFIHQAIILKSGKPIVFGQSCQRTTKKGSQYWSMHAERDAINKLTAQLRIPFPEHFIKIRDENEREKILRKTRRYEIIVFRNNCGKTSESTPCCDCAKLLKLYQFKKITYSINEFDFITCKAKYLSHSHLTKGHRIFNKLRELKQIAAKHGQISSNQ